MENGKLEQFLEQKLYTGKDFDNLRNIYSKKEKKKRMTIIRIKKKNIKVLKKFIIKRKK